VRPGATHDESGAKEHSSEGRLAEIGAMARSERLGSLPFPELSTSADSRAQYPILKRDCQRLFLRNGGATGALDGTNRFAVGGKAGIVTGHFKTSHSGSNQNRPL
jgi:hypothetical protein